MRLLPVCLLIIITLQLSGQISDKSGSTESKEDKFVRWIACLPSEEESNSSGFFEKIFNLIVGQDPVVFNNPVSTYARDYNNYWIVNQGNGTILQFRDKETNLLPAFRKKDKLFTSLIAICDFGSKGLLFTDSRMNKIFYLSEDGKMMRSFNDTVILNRPTGIAYSESKKEIWVVETGSHRISVFDMSGQRKTILGHRGSGPLEFNFPTSIWIDKSGKVYIVDAMNYRIQILSSEGEYITSFGRQGDASGYFGRPKGIATDSSGNIYVVDALFNVVQIFDASGRLLYYFGSQGSGKYQFWMPSGIFIDKNDHIYVSDSYNSRVQIFQYVKNIQ